MKKRLLAPIMLCALLWNNTSFAQEIENQIDSQNYSALETTELFDLTLEQLLGINVKEDNKFSLYGFMQANVERVYAEPSINALGKTERENAPLEWDPAKNFHIYGAGHLNEKIDVLFNIAAPGGDNFEVRNAWGNFKIKDILQVRVGKMYRKFGLYNEKLDQTPTFIGIEPPELFDTDHLFITRTTNFMIHGEKEISKGTLSYAFTHDNGEGGPTNKVIPLGWDFRFKSQELGLIIGTSGFTSSITNEKSTSTVDFHSGSPKGGILPWMDGDHFTVVGGFAEKKIGKILIQTEFWNAKHNAIRNANNTLDLVQNGGINNFQRSNFLGSNASKDNSQLTEDDIVTNVTYNAQTFYVRLGYTIETNRGQFVPYVFFDWMSNPEVVKSKSWGGDNEAGLADNGKFAKPSLGLVYRPIPSVAIKLDGSVHSQKYNGETIMYPEVRLDFSFAFDALKGIWEAK